MRYTHRRLSLGAATLLLLASLNLPLLAQSAVGAIRGTVMDQQGAVVANAEVAVTNKATGSLRKTNTGDDGSYSVDNLLPGDYEVKVQVKGFATQVLSLAVQVGKTTTGDASLRVGAADEVVEVIGAAPILDKQSYKIDGVITRERIENLPLNGRSFLSLALLEPGVTVTYNADPGPAPNNFFRVAIAGAPSQFTRIMVDGASVNDRITGGTSQNFSQETVEEFQITSFNFDLSTGNTSAGAVNIVSRTGSNDVHGSAFFFYRDSNLAAFPGFRRPCDPVGPHPNCGDPVAREALENPFFARRQGGFNLGGPFKKDKAFWFANFENISQAGARTIAHGDPTFFGLNHIGQPRFTGRLFNARVDYNVSSKHRAFLRYSQDTSTNLSGTGNLESTWSHTRNVAAQGLLGVTSILRTNLVSDARFSYSFYSGRLRPPDESECDNPLFCFGLGGPRISISGGPTIGNDVNVPQNRVLRTYQITENLSWQKGSHRIKFGGNWEHLYGQGSWARIAQGLFSMFSPQQVLQRAGQAAFNALPLSLRDPRFGPPTFADMLKLPVSGVLLVGVGDSGQPPSFRRDEASRNDSYRLYFQDSWQIRPSFTFNYGMAWSFEDNIVSHDLDKPAFLRPVIGNLNPTRKDYNNFQPSVGFAWTLGKQNNTVIRAGTGIYHNSTNLIFTRLGERGFIGPAGNGLITFDSSLVPNPFFGQPGQPATLFFPNPTTMTGEKLLSILPGVRSALSARWGTGTDISLRGIEVSKQAPGIFGDSIFHSDVTTGYTFHTTAGVQRQLTSNMGVSVDFVMRRGVHFGGYDSAFGVDTNRWNRFKVLSVAADGRVTNQRNPIIRPCSLAESLVPKLQCSTGPITVYQSSINARYTGLFVRLYRQFSRGIQFTGSYALSRYYVWNGVIDFEDVLASYGIGDPDRTHRFTFSGIWDLPDYKGGARWARAMVNGWQLSLITENVSSPPMTVSAGGFDLEGDGSSILILPGTKVNGFGRSSSAADIRRLVEAYNSTIPAPPAGAPATYQKRDAQNRVVPFVVLPPNFSNGDTFLTQDMRISRMFGLTERAKLTLIAEGFNVFNVANLTGYGSTLNARVPAGQIQPLTFGRPSDRVNQVFGSGGPRSFQVAARLSW